MKYILAMVEIETDNIIGAKEQIAAALENIGKVTFPKVVSPSGAKEIPVYSPHTPYPEQRTQVYRNEKFTKKWWEKGV